MIVRCVSGMVLPDPLHIWMTGRINGHPAGCSTKSIIPSKFIEVGGIKNNRYIVYICKYDLNIKPLIE